MQKQECLHLIKQTNKELTKRFDHIESSKTLSMFKSITKAGLLPAGNYYAMKATVIFVRGNDSNERNIRPGYNCGER